MYPLDPTSRHRVIPWPSGGTSVNHCATEDDNGSYFVEVTRGRFLSFNHLNNGVCMDHTAKLANRESQGSVQRTGRDVSRRLLCPSSLFQSLPSWMRIVK